MYIEILRSNLKAVLVLGDINLTQLAAASGVSRSRLAEIMNGTVTGIRLELAEKLAEALGVTLPALLTPLNKSNFQEFFQKKRTLLPIEGMEFVEGFLSPGHAKEFWQKAQQLNFSVKLE